MEFVVPESGEGERLDRTLAKLMPEFSRARLQSHIKEGRILLNAQPTKPGAVLKSEDRIQVAIPEGKPFSDGPVAQNLGIPVLYEDDQLIVADKPSGMPVHAGPGHNSGTLVNALLHHCEGRLSALAGEDRPGIVHRLDKGTSGCLVAAKTDEAYTSLTAQFAERRTKKWYLAVIRGTPKGSGGKILNQLARHPVDRKRRSVTRDGSGKIAETDWLRGPSREGGSLILCRLHTGRTHQIRVHMKENVGFPILGDELYGKWDAPRLMLHAWRLGFFHPVTGEEVRKEAPPPPEFAPWLENWDLQAALSLLS